MATTNRIGGVLTLVVDGQAYEARGAFQVNASTVKREAVVGLDGIHGYTEVPIAVSIHGDISIGNELSIAQLESITDSTVVITLANGRLYTFAQAWCTSALSIDPAAGKVAVVFEGMAVQEMLQQG